MLLLKKLGAHEPRWSTHNRQKSSRNQAILWIALSVFYGWISSAKDEGLDCAMIEQ
jgi:hypothetical protein